jgi:ABC-type amino acid transport substrate-binding protein
VLRSEPYMTQRATLVTRRTESDITTLDPLRALQVAVPSGSWAHVLLVKAEIPVLVRFHDDDQIIGAVVNGIAGAGIVSEAGLGWFRRMHPDVALTATTAPIAGFHLEFDIGVGLRQSDYASLNTVNAILSRMKEDGTIRAILERYGVPYHAPMRS